jgi:Ca2+-binding EF-hand superfamily protein
MYDLDDDGWITKNDLFQNLKFYSKESKFRLTDEAVEKIVDAIVHEIDKNGDGKIGYE